MKRWILGIVLLAGVLAGGIFVVNRYWIHRYDALIRRHAQIYHVDPDLVWSIIYQETYFRSWKKGEHGEIGLMQVRPSVGKEWAAETGMRGLIAQMDSDPESVLSDPEWNIPIACWYLEKLQNQFRDTPGAEARMVAGYNAGPSRAADWNKVPEGASPLSADDFINRIDISSTRAYVTAIIDRYRQLKSKSTAAKLRYGEVSAGVRMSNPVALVSPRYSPVRARSRFTRTDGRFW
jgi:soluble lytic murein transglycosylase